MRPAWTFVRTLAIATFGIATALGVVSGCVAAVTWGITAFGAVAVIAAGAFVAGCIITTAVFAAAGHSVR